jgi:chromosome segregation ATPase
MKSCVLQSKLSIPMTISSELKNPPCFEQMVKLLASVGPDFYTSLEYDDIQRLLAGIAELRSKAEARSATQGEKAPKTPEEIGLCPMPPTEITEKPITRSELAAKCQALQEEREELRLRIGNLLDLKNRQLCEFSNTIGERDKEIKALQAEAVVSKQEFSEVERKLASLTNYSDLKDKECSELKAQLALIEETVKQLKFQVVAFFNKK